MSLPGGPSALCRDRDWLLNRRSWLHTPVPHLGRKRQTLRERVTFSSEAMWPNFSNTFPLKLMFLLTSTDGGGGLFLKICKIRRQVPGEKAAFWLILRRMFCNRKGFWQPLLREEGRFLRLVDVHLETRNCLHAACDFFLIVRVLPPSGPLCFTKSKN